MQGIRLAHWANYIGLAALGCYLGIYLPLFVAIARVAHHRWRVPLMVAGPVVWTGVELARGYGPLGFSMALLGHSQIQLPHIIQISDLFGAYSISFLVMTVAAGAMTMYPTRRRGWMLWPLVPMFSLVFITLGYGHYRLRQIPPGSERPPVRVAIIQGSIDTVFEDNPERPREMLDQYSDLTQNACEQYQALDLVLWPETMFPIEDLVVEKGALPQIDPPWDLGIIEDVQSVFRHHVDARIRDWNQRTNSAATVPRKATSWIFGVATWQFGDYPSRRYNTALMVDSRGTILGRYYKMRPVIFGEYVPLGEVVPALYHLFPLPNGLTSGSRPVSWEVAGLKVTPSICFENTMPHLIRWHVAELDRRGERPDVLVNLTNDGWFWGSSILDMQLNCAVLRAVEMRRPFLVAANTGFSAWIDGNGTVRAKGPRHAKDTLLAEVVPDGRTSWYEKWGDVPLSLCVVFSLIMAVTELCSRLRRPERPTSNVE